ncbi:MAG: amidophosphoribosyltransferase, partial [bacterium]|nr:amidophosphoribosyltransferase [bacterium]
SELFLTAIANTDAENVFDAIAKVLAHTRGTFSILIMGEGWLVAARDPWGNRPLSIGALDDGWVAASETVTHDVLRAKLIREVAPGEMFVFANGTMAARRFAPSARLHQCVFEKTYLSRPDSIVFGETVATFQERVGRYMARMVSHYPNEIIVPVPDSGNLYAYGFAKERTTTLTPALVRAHHGGRSYIEPRQSQREDSVRRKLNPIRSLIAGNTVILVDDSIVRGTTSRKIVRMVRGAGARRIVFVSCYPPTTGQCYYGVLIDEELIAVGRNTEEIRAEIEADELYYPLAEDYKELTRDSNNYCFACFDGIYPSLVNIT